MAGRIADTLHKVEDAVAGTAGKMGAAATSSADGFVESAAIGDMYEIRSARMALARSRNEEVRRIARKIIADHTTSTHHLHAALEMRETRGVAPPPGEPDTRRKTMLDHLEGAPDDAFDRTYLDQQVLGHEETVSLMRHYGKSGDNAQLRSVAQGTLPVVERHLKHVKEVRAKL